MANFRLFSNRLVSSIVFIYFLHVILTSFAVAIMVREPFVEQRDLEGGNGDREFIIDHILNQERDKREFLRIMPCVVSFLKKYIIEPDRSSFFLPIVTEDILQITETLIKDLKNDIVHFVQTGEVDLHMKQRSASSTIVLMENDTCLENVVSGLLTFCDRSCIFIMILTTRIEDEETFLEVTDNLIQSSWNERISRIVVLAPVENSVLVAGSISFKPYEPCNPSFPILLDTCEGNEWNNLDMISTLSLNGCIVKLAYFELYPYVITSNISEVLAGIEGAIMEEVMRQLDVEVTREKMTWHGNTTFLDEVRLCLMNESQADLVIGGVPWNPDHEIDYTNTYETTKIVWIIPTRPNVSLRGLVKPFDVYVWAAIAGALLFGGVVRIFLIPDISWLDIFALIIGVSTATQPTKTASRLQFISWSIFGLFLTQLYVDSLADQLMNVSELQIETLEELLSSTFQIGGRINHKEMFEEDDDDVEERDYVAEIIKERFIVLNRTDYMMRLADLLDGRNDSLALIVVLNFSRAEDMKMATVNVMEESISHYPLSLATWKGLPYLFDINQIIRNFIEIGLLDFWIRRSISYNTTLENAEEESRSELHIEEFAPAFLLLIIGFSGGFCMLIIEIITYPSKLLE